VSNKLPLVGVSACLLGHPVRYDGQHKYSSPIATELIKYCRLLPVCPEIEIGLGVPRAKIQLTQVGTVIKVLKKDDPMVDFSDALQKFAIRFIKKNFISGLVLQDKSPSCGVGNTKLFSQSGEEIGLESGLFAATVKDLVPELVVVRANQLQSQDDIEWFVEILNLKVEG